MPSVQSKGKQVATEQFDEAAFERAFDQAAQDMMGEVADMQPDEAAAYETGASTGNYEDQVERARREAMTAIHGHQRRFSQDLEGRITDDMSNTEVFQRLDDIPMEEEVPALQDVEKQLEGQQGNDDDALAATAQELLEKVEHNQSDKFRNSQFLGLMRRLRDREVKVEGDQMVETVRAALKPPTSAPDSAYVSGTATPEPYLYHPYRRTPPPEFDSHFELGYDEDHEFDHWESPYN